MRSNRQQGQGIAVRSFIGACALLLMASLAHAVAPTAPTNLTATAVSTTQINLTWLDTSDSETSFKIERKTGTSGTYAQIATVGTTVTNFSNTGLASGTTYFYRVRASNASGNSAYTNQASATTLVVDTSAPAAPTGLTAAVASASQINLSWTASTDNVRVTGYQVERCTGASCTAFAQIAASGGTSLTDAGLAAATNYSYRVRAADAAGNLSTFSNIASVTTQAAPDSSAPTVPTGLTATATSANQVNLSWNASTDNVGVVGYRVERCTLVNFLAGCSAFAQVAAPMGTSISDTGLAERTTYRYQVRAVDAAGNFSAYSALVGVTTPPSDTTAPTTPTGLTATSAGVSQINLSWTASTDNVGVTGYILETCIGASCTNFIQTWSLNPSTSMSDTNLNGGTTYRYRMRATDAAGNLSGYSNIASATTAADTVAPSVPTGLTATAEGASLVSLNWNASTDNVGFATGYLLERCQGAACTAFAQVAAVTAFGFRDTGLAAATTYRYRVRATDAAGNLSGYSTALSVTTLTALADPTAPPSAPTGLTATAASPTQVNLSWTASTDNVGVVGYRVERCTVWNLFLGCGLVQVAAPSGTNFSDSGLAERTRYRYRVRAVDGGGNFSGYSSEVDVTTPSSDTTAPTAPTGLVATVMSSTQINLSWTASTDNVGVATYLVEICRGVGCTDFAEKFSTSVTGTSLNDTSLAYGTTYRYRVRARDAAFNFSGYSNTVSATTPSSADTTSPTPPGDFWATAASTSQINLRWTAAFDDVGVTEYRVERCQGASCTTFAQLAVVTPSGTSFSDTGLAAATTYQYRMRATDAAGNLSAYTFVRSATTLSVADTTAPTAPTGLAATAASATQINLSWTASTDNVGVTEYRVERCQGAGCTTFAQVAEATPSSTGFGDTNLTAGTSYSYRVRAADAAGNLSGYSNIASATTQGAADTTPPTAPAGLTATAASSSQINLTWTASTDNVGVTGYQVDRCQGAGCTIFAQVATPTGTSFNDTVLTPSTSYSYRVRATDAAGNISTNSSIATATTQAPPDTTAPTAPTGLTATSPSTTQINLTWTASTDNAGVTGYRVERCQGAGCTNFVEIAAPTATSFSNTGLTAATSYSYRVRATDAAGNLSAYSNVASATTGTGQVQAYYIHPDHLNTPRLIEDTNGTMVWRWDQGEPFGNDVPNNNPSGAGTFDFNLRFPGQYFDRETSNYYNMARDYSAEVGRYGESDPIGLHGGLNTYAYVGGNPISFADSLGLAPPRPGGYYNPLPIPGQGPPTLVQNQGGFYDAVGQFTNLPIAPGTGGDWSGITVPWTMPKGIPNDTPWCSWDCPKNPGACSPNDPPNLTGTPSFFAPQPGCVWRCRPGPFIGPR